MLNDARKMGNGGPVHILTLDRLSDVDELRLIATEVDNDTGRSVLLSIYDGVDTTSAIAKKLGISMQLASYHIEKLLRSDFIKPGDDTTKSNRNGRKVRHYVVARTAVFIAPSLEGLRREGKEGMNQAFSSIMKRVFGCIAIGVASFVTVDRVLAAMNSIIGKSSTTVSIGGSTVGLGPNAGGTISMSTAAGSPVWYYISSASRTPPSSLPLLLSVTIPVSIGAVCAFFVLRWIRRRASTSSSNGDGSFDKPVWNQ